MEISCPSLAFTVTRSPPELIPPAKPTPHELKPLSDLDDQKSYRLHARVVQFYKQNDTMQGVDPARVIKAAIAEALVLYYPFAGRLREGEGGKLMVDCTGEGVLFTEASADVRMEEFGDVVRPPIPGIDQIVYNVPGSDGILGCPLLLIQVTRLVCGGFIFAIRVNHTMSDAVGLINFMTAVGEISRAHTPSIQPIWERELLTARDTPRVTCTHHAYRELSDPMPTPVYDMTNLVQRSFFFSLDDIIHIRNQVPPRLLPCSKFEILTACLWRCRTICLNLNPDDEICVAFPVNARKKFTPHLPAGYYGNVLGFPATLSTAQELCNKPLGYALELIKKAKADVTEEFMRSSIDLMVKRGRPMYTSHGTFKVTDLTHMTFVDVDFGWGKAIYGGTCGNPWVSMFVSSKNNKGDEGILVMIDLPGPNMKIFATEIEKMITN